MTDETIQLIYDKQCPACHFYCQIVRIRKSAGKLQLIDARESPEILRELTAMNLDIDQGMVLKMKREIYYGSEAIHMLSLLSTRHGMFNKLNFWMFRSRYGAKLIYPVLRCGRNLLLKILGKSKINNLNLPDNYRF